MYRGLFLAVVFLAAASADSDEDFKKCIRVFDPRTQHHCCKREFPLKHPHDHAAFKECMQLQGKPPSCEREICMAAKSGIASSDGKINKEELQKMVDQKFSENPELAKLVKDNCVDGDLSKYGEADLCEPLKLKICTDIQFASSCPEWDDAGECAEVKDLVTECLEKFA